MIPEVSDKTLAVLVGGLWTVTSAFAAALYAQIMSKQKKQDERLDRLESEAATRADVGEIKQLIRDNTQQTEAMRKESRDSVINVHNRVDSLANEHHALAVKVAGQRD